MESSKNKILLITEDEPALRYVLRDKLSNIGFKVFEAADGEEGLAVALKERPDLILLDLLMPKMEGISMLKKLREDEWGKKVKVLVLTNLEDTNKISEAIEHGAEEYLVKSDWTIESIVSKVREKFGI